MKKILQITILSLVFIGTLAAQNFEKITLNESDELGGYYLAMKPYDSIKGVLVLFPTRGFSPESIFAGTKLQNLAWANGILTIAVSAGSSFYA
ncbi:MAG: hypothetical protein WBM43_12960, partial [Flavobacteriaceae bacterium]